MESGALILIRLFVIVVVGLVGLWLAFQVFKGLAWLLGRVFYGIGFGVSGIFRGIGFVLGKVGRFVKGIVTDSLRLVGGVVTAIFYAICITANIGFGRWSAANHYGQAMEGEVLGLAGCAYRLAIGHVAHLFGLTPLTEGIERRVPEVVARAPGPDRPGHFTGEFEGYEITGSLQGGGSGAKLFLATPTEAKRRQLQAAGRSMPDKVVIKSFSLMDGSSMPQIVRENRALEAARNLGLVLEHELGSKRFHYVMPFVPGDDLAIVTARMHAISGPDGLNDDQLARAMTHASDLLGTLKRFHDTGLWHKDVKPSNIIVSNGRVQLVDLGLITPLASAMTLTTHGTEYFRDPELVRLALKGVKVHEVDGVKFDVYGAGAVLYSMIENSFPAHGNLSQITRRCPEALRWVVRRAMSDMSSRYGSAEEMLTDLRVVLACSDPFAMKPAELPSLAGQPAVAAALSADATPAPFHHDPNAGPGSVPHPALAQDAAPAPKRSTGARIAAVLGGIAAALLITGVAAVTLFSVRGAGFDPASPVAKIEGTSTVFSNTPQRLLVLPTVSLDRMSDPVFEDGIDSTPVGTLLVLEDVPAAAEPSARPRLESLYNGLRGGRWQLLGLDDVAADDDELALLAGARAAVGLSDPGDPEAVARLSLFLRDQDLAIDAIIWVGGTTDEQTARMRLITRDQQTEAELAALIAGGEKV